MVKNRIYVNEHRYELSCEERVLKEMHILNGSPIAIGEGNMKRRIKNVLNYKKPRYWVSVAAIIAVIAVGFGLLSNPKKKSENESINIQTQGPYSIVFLNPIYSVTGEGFASARQDNEYQFKEDIFKIISKIEKENISVINPVYEQEVVKNRISVMGEMSFDVSKYFNKQCFRVITPDGTDTGYIIYKMDDEVWISHWRWFGKSKDAWWCEYILRII